MSLSGFGMMFVHTAIHVPLYTTLFALGAVAVGTAIAIGLQ